MSSLPFDSSSSWDDAGSGHHGSGHHVSSHGSHHHTPHHTHSSPYSPNHYSSHSSSHQGSHHQGVHQGWHKSSVHRSNSWEQKPHQVSTASFGLKNGYKTASFTSDYASPGSHYSSAAGHHPNSQSHHHSSRLVMNCSSSDDIRVVKIFPDGDIWWKGGSKGSLQGVYIKNHSGNIVAKFVDHRVWLWSGDRYVDVGYAQNAQEAVYDGCVKYRALGS